MVPPADRKDTRMTLPDDAQRARGEAPLALLGVLALMTSVVAMTIDAVLPALDAISGDLGFADPNDRHLVVMLVFAGLGLAQPVFGPLADAVGRKRAAMAGWGIYLAGTVLGLLAWSPEAMLAGRFLQGLGAAGPRVVAIAVVRDLYSGRAMARVLSVVMTIFMLVPMVAPLLGQGAEALAGWRAIFGLYLAMAVAAALWYLAVPETLAPEARRPLLLRPVAAAMRETLSTRQTVICTLAAVAGFGAFVAYLAVSQQVLEELYALGPLFPLAFGALALVFALATFANSRLVGRLGMRSLALTGFGAMTLTAAGGAVAAAMSGGVPPFWLVMALLAVIFFCVALLFANLQALAVEPLGHIAGTASAMVLSASTLGAAIIGGAIAALYDGSVTPLFAGFAGLGLAGLGLLALGGTMEEGATA
jgi:DHA1 family bicyclomycin/chloramphenicol resistance-like MFS transporter